jgi:hypothetical protein
MLFDWGHRAEPAQRRELVELTPIPDAPDHRDRQQRA